MKQLGPIEGLVRRGKGRGRELGFPTANLAVDDASPELNPGVYAARVSWDDGPEYGAVVNYGVRPTFAETEFCLELYVIDFSGDLYDKRMTLELIQRLRDERRFEGTDDLKRQITNDIERARRILASPQPV